MLRRSRVWVISALTGAAAATRLASCEGNSTKTKTGEDPLACKQKACRGKMDMMQRAFESARGQQQKPQVQQQGCPVDREELGVSTWALLHTLAANIPEEPTEEEQKMLHQMVVGLARFYPCSICATDFQQSVASSPPATQSRAAFSLWMCRLHNEVNIKIGEGEFPCAMDKLDLRWRDGGTACDEEPIARSSADDEAAPREQLEGIFHKERTKSNAH